MALEAHAHGIQRQSIKGYVALYVCVGLPGQCRQVVRVQGDFDLMHRQSVEELVAVVRPPFSGLQLGIGEVGKRWRSRLRGKFRASEH